MPIPALFLHIQKTAGTSVVHTVRKYYKNDVVSHLDFHLHEPAAFNGTGFISGHFGYDYAQPLMHSRYCFTFLRDPSERVLSFYYFCLRSDPEEYAVYKLAQTNSLDDFLEMGLAHPQVRAFIWNHQTWQLACGWGNCAKKSIAAYDEKEMIRLAKTHLSEFDHVGFKETFDTDMATILNRLQIKKRTGPVARTNVSPRRPPVEDLAPSTRDRLQQITMLDQSLYDHAWGMRSAEKKTALHK